MADNNFGNSNSNNSGNSDFATRLYTTVFVKKDASIHKAATSVHLN